ncbi:MAG: cyclic nucleotide-binding domain-containing protein [Actinobacteria bacterium]|jgi:CRP-like cAMP-binding protein|nr:cyclic nucleotide-binding domain-containing protein [Actinomycetota bacterium]
MRTLAEYLPEHPFFAGLDPASMDVVLGCAQNVHFAAGEMLFQTGSPADTFYVIRQGRVALEAHDPRSGTMVVATLSEGEVAGWSWLVPPYRWMFDARAVSPVSAVALDGDCLRGKCDQDPALGYALMQRVAHVMYERLQDARIRLLDLYGEAP